ncbi:hypothetical protein GCM10010238_01960 [Streptomyces griseoviridis]|uniref:DUF2637 domain-containing protein n=1 Tax=Streptomyces griseoviridis TaxID=45398 RepID=A0A918L863_STRGD|nr:hypothetical protein GCM10010238_01960 [Streptomyces niveoruber]
MIVYDDELVYGRGFPGPYAAHPYPYPYPYAGPSDETAHGRHRAPADDDPAFAPDMSWDEELAVMLQDALEEHRPAERTPRSRRDGPDETPAATPAPGSPLGNLRDITEELPPLRDPAPARSHRRTRPPRAPRAPRPPRTPSGPRGPRGIEAVSYVTAVLATVIASGVSLLSGIVAYDPLRVVAVTRLEPGVVSWWPLLVFGPWLVASLSVLRAALHQRRALHAWCVVLGFSLIAVFLCVLQAPGTVVDVAAAALPGLASLACFQQLVRQITLTRPPRRRAPRHRVRPEPRQSAGPDRTAGAAPHAGTEEALGTAPLPDAVPGPVAGGGAPDPVVGTAPPSAVPEARHDGTARPARTAPPPRAPRPAVRTYVISNGRPLRTRSFPAPRDGR